MTRPARGRAARPTPAPRPASPARTAARAGRTRFAAFRFHGDDAVSPGETRGWTIVATVLAALSLIGAAVMILGPHAIGDYFTESDFYGGYADGARLVQHGRLIPSRYTVVGPGYEVALALWGWIVRDLFLAAESLSALASAATALLWFHLLRRRLDARVGVAAVLFLVTNNWFFRFSFSATTDAFANALQALALFTLLGFPDSEAAASPARRARFAVAGIVAALAFLTRYNAVYLLPAGLVAILAGGAGAGAPRRGRAALAFGAGFLVPVLPWVLFSLAHGGNLQFQLHHNIAYEVFARSKGIAWDNYQKQMQAEFPNLASVIARDPAAVARQVFVNIGGHLRDDGRKLLAWPVAIAAIAGLVLAVRDRRMRRLWPVLAAGALLFATLVPVFYSERYSLALLPVYATLAGIAFASPFAALTVGGARRVWLKAAGALALVAATIPATVRMQRHDFAQLPTEVLDVGRVLRGLRQPGDRVIARKGHIAYYGDCGIAPFPFADGLAPLADYARRSHARWMYFSWPEAETRPVFWYLLDTTAVVPGLTQRYASDIHPAVLYEIGPEFGREPAWLANDTLLTYHMLRGKAGVTTGDAQTFQRLGIVAWSLGHLVEARDAFMHASVIEPGRLDHLISLGRVLVALEDLDHAGAIFARAVRLDPSSVDARISLGLVAYLSGHEREAADAWRPVIASTPDPTIARAMEQVYTRLGDGEAAAAARARLEALRVPGPQGAQGTMGGR